MLRGSSKTNRPSSILGARHFRGTDARADEILMIMYGLEVGSSIVADSQGRGCAISRWREVKEGKGRSPSIRCCRALTLMASASD
jgi:hypothetical protein